MRTPLAVSFVLALMACSEPVTPTPAPTPCAGAAPTCYTDFGGGLCDDLTVSGTCVAGAWQWLGGALLLVSLWWLGRRVAEPSG